MQQSRDQRTPERPIMYSSLALYLYCASVCLQVLRGIGVNRCVDVYGFRHPLEEKETLTAFITRQCHNQETCIVMAINATVHTQYNTYSMKGMGGQTPTQSLPSSLYQPLSQSVTICLLMATVPGTINYTELSLVRLQAQTVHLLTEYSKIICLLHGGEDNKFQCPLKG